MPQTTTQQMGEAHEVYLAAINKGVKSKGSGSQWTDQGDGRNHHDLPFAFCWDGKSTRGKSVPVTLEMLAKIREQAQGDRPQIGLRWYGSDDLRVVLEDWVAVQGADFEEILMAARQLKELEAAGVTLDKFLALGDDLRRASESLAGAVKLIAERSEAIQRRDEQIERLSALVRAGESDPRQVPGFLPALPWTVVHVGRRQFVPFAQAVIRYDADGSQHVETASEVHVDRSPGNRPRIMVDNRICPDCDVYVDGILTVRAWRDHPDKEIG